MQTPKVGGRYKRLADGTIVPADKPENILVTADPAARDMTLPALESADEHGDAIETTNTPAGGD
ncbi:MAG: hypothetical protein M0Q49_06445 [Porticoccaceae bacterium]|nr:hypothetical protein [Porticoccaceae bacterium]